MTILDYVLVLALPLVGGFTGAVLAARWLRPRRAQTTPTEGPDEHDRITAHATSSDAARDLWNKPPAPANEPLYVRDPLPTLTDIRRVLDDLHERGEPIPGEIVLSRAQWDHLTKRASPTAMGPVGLDSMALALFGIPVRFTDTNPGQRPFDIIEARQRLDKQVRDMLNDLPERAKTCTCVVELDNRKIQKLALDCPIHILTENPDQEGLR